MAGGASAISPAANSTGKAVLGMVDIVCLHPDRRAQHARKAAVAATSELLGNWLKSEPQSTEAVPQMREGFALKLAFKLVANCAKHMKPPITPGGENAHCGQFPADLAAPHNTVAQGRDHECRFGRLPDAM